MIEPNMEVTYATPAIVLINKPWSEYDSKVVFYTPNQGQMSLVARGSRKPLSKLTGHLQPYNWVKLMVINGRHYPYAGAASTVDCFWGLKQDWSKLTVANQVLSVWQKLTSQAEPDPRLFALLINFLQILNKIKAEELYYQWLAKTMLLKALCYLGYQPDIDLIQQRLGFLNNDDYYWQPWSTAQLIALQTIINQPWPQSIKDLSLNRNLATTVNEIIDRLLVLVLEK
ncbi:MAG: DNA repair protein RecO [bacterium]